MGHGEVGAMMPHVEAGRSSIWIRVAMIAAVPIVFSLAYVDLQREEASAVADFTLEQASLARSTAATLETRLAGVVGRLDDVATALPDPQPVGRADGQGDGRAEALLRRMIGGDSVYRAADVVSASGVASLELVAGTARRMSELGAVAAARSEALAALASGTTLHISAPLAIPGAITAVPSTRGNGRFRIFASRGARRAGGDGQAVLLLVDMERLLSGLLVGPDPASPTPPRWLVLDDKRRWVVFGRGDPAVSADDAGGGAVQAVGAGEETLWREGDGGVSGDLASLLARMADGQRGAILLERAGAESVGLERRRAAAGYAPVEIDVAAVPRARWSVAVITSARRVRDRARMAAWRLGAATGLAGLLVALFAVVMVRQDRRAQRLAAALRREHDLARTEKLATIGTLAAGIAHEVGTPLGIISGRAEQLLDRLSASDGADPMKRGLASILAQVDKVSLTIRQLLDFARVRPVETTAVSPALSLEAAVALLEHRFRRAQVSLQMQASPSLPLISADPGQLEQVLVNLLINACDACEARGTPARHVTARATRAGDLVQIEISDDGVGIPRDHLALVQNPFFTTKKRGQGTGLGLSIVADIVKNHRGTLLIDSEEGRGTTVRVSLPITEAP